MFRTFTYALVIVSCCACAVADSRAPFIVPVGDFPGGCVCTSPEAVTNGGDVVVGGAGARSGFDEEAFRWTPSDGIQPLRPLETSTGQAYAFTVSWDGSVIFGTQRQPDDETQREVFRWTAETGALGLGDAMGITSNQKTYVLDATPDGETIVGGISSTNRYDGYRWSAAEGLTWLGSLPGGNDRSYGSGISDDGRVVVGSAVTQFSWRAFRWSAEDGMRMIGPLEGPLYAWFAAAVSADGTIVAGTAMVDDSYLDGYRWTEAGGFELLGADPAAFNFIATTDMSADGRVIVGHGGPVAHPNGSWIWDKAHGLRNLRAVLANDYGLDMTRWQFQGATAISPDGRTIVGIASFQGADEGYVAFLGDPVACPGDATGDRQVNISDLGAMLSHYGMASGAAESDGDTDADGDVDSADLQTLLTHFGDLCPL